jgi:hypothetical protein
MDNEFNQLDSPSFTRIPKEDISSGFSDIILRTMESDIQAVKQSGGDTSEVYKSAKKIHISQPQKQEIKNSNVTSQSVPQISLKENPTSEKKETPAIKEISFILKIILGIIAILGFFAIGYFILPQILPQKKQEKIETKVTTSTENMVGLPQPSTIQNDKVNQISTESILDRFLKIKPEQTIELNLDISITNFNKYYNFLIIDSLENQTSSKTTSTNLFALILKDKNNSLLKWNDFLKSLNINLTPNDTWNNINSEFIGFIYKNKDGIWPGYILELNKTMAPSLIQIDLKKTIEADKNTLKNFFINEPDFTGFEFKSGQVFNREPIKILESKTKGASFVYGLFFNKYIIISTSLNGLEEILRKM